VEDDHVEAVVQRWRELRPDLDPSPMLVIARLSAVEATIDERLRPPFAEAGLASGDFDLLAALRRQGPPHEASPGDLAAAMLVTTGATTKRIDRLEGQRYVTRRTATDDRRGRVVALTAAGRRLTDRLIAVHLQNEAALLAGLTPRQRGDLARLLKALGRSLR
jgi:DNA-binding MarR family transcriptional regulator